VSHRSRSEDEGGRCTCWVVMRGDTARPDGWESAEFELVPDSSCPVHGGKPHPIPKDEEGIFSPDVEARQDEAPGGKEPMGDEGVSEGVEVPGSEGTTQQVTTVGDDGGSPGKGASRIGEP
jgi:hypothetical protein